MVPPRWLWQLAWREVASRRRLDAMAAEAGRDPKSITISVYGQPPDGVTVRSYLDAGADRHVANEYEKERHLKRMAGAVLL